MPIKKQMWFPLLIFLPFYVTINICFYYREKGIISMKKYLNCFAFVFRNGSRGFQRKGIPCDEMKHNRLLINGLGRYQVFIKPLSIEDGWQDEDLIKAFEHYEGKYPWIGQEKDERMYIYSMNIARENYYLNPYDNNGGHVDYAFLETPGKGNIKCLGGSSQLLFRRFEGDKQYAMFELKGYGMIRYSDDGSDIMLEYLGDGKFISR